MIELDNTKVLRFRYEEVVKLGNIERHKYDAMVDWFASYLYQQYPDMCIVVKTHHEATDTVWVIMRKEYPIVEETVHYDEDVPFVEEKLIN